MRLDSIHQTAFSHACMAGFPLGGVEGISWLSQGCKWTLVVLSEVMNVIFMSIWVSGILI